MSKKSASRIIEDSYKKAQEELGLTDIVDQINLQSTVYMTQKQKDRYVRNRFLKKVLIFVIIVSCIVLLVL